MYIFYILWITYYGKDDALRCIIGRGCVELETRRPVYLYLDVAKRRDAPVRNLMRR